MPRGKRKKRKKAATPKPVQEPQRIRPWEGIRKLEAAMGTIRSLLEKKELGKEHKTRLNSLLEKLRRNAFSQAKKIYLNGLPPSPYPAFNLPLEKTRQFLMEIQNYEAIKSDGLLSRQAWHLIHFCERMQNPEILRARISRKRAKHGIELLETSEVQMAEIKMLLKTRKIRTMEGIQELKTRVLSVVTLTAREAARMHLDGQSYKKHLEKAMKLIDEARGQIWGNEIAKKEGMQTWLDGQFAFLFAMSHRKNLENWTRRRGMKQYSYVSTLYITYFLCFCLAWFVSFYCSAVIINPQTTHLLGHFRKGKFIHNFLDKRSPRGGCSGVVPSPESKKVRWFGYAISPTFCCSGFFPISFFRGCRCSAGCLQVSNSCTKFQAFSRACAR